MRLHFLFKKVRKAYGSYCLDSYLRSVLNRIAYLLHSDDRFANLDCCSAFIELYGIMQIAIRELRGVSNEPKDTEER